MNCRRAMDLWMAGFDGESPPSTASLAHVEACPECGARSESARRTRGAMRHLAVPCGEADASARRVASALRGAVPPVRRIAIPAGPILGPVATGFAATLSAALLLGGQVGSPASLPGSAPTAHVSEHHVEAWLDSPEATALCLFRPTPPPRREPDRRPLRRGSARARHERWTA